MKIWLDDIRNMPPGYDIHVHSVNEAIAVIEKSEANGENILLIIFRREDPVSMRSVEARMEAADYRYDLKLVSELMSTFLIINFVQTKR